MSKRVAILQSNYIPWKGYFDLINGVDEFIYYDDVQYTKNDWRNRNRIKTHAGVQWLTIPVRQESLEQKICEVKVAQANWAEKHWRTLLMNYAKAPHFKELQPRFEAFYGRIDSEFISRINQDAISFVCGLMGITTKLSSTEDYRFSTGKNERLVDLVSQAGGTEYVSGPAARSYLDEDLFREAGISVSWMDYSGYREYPQLFPPFEHGVSVVDLLFNTGALAPTYLKSYKA